MAVETKYRVIQFAVIVKGDEVNKYILLANAHDGSLTARVGFVPIR